MRCVCVPCLPRRDRHWRGAGLAVPVFSLRTHHSVGVGEFLDLIPLVDLADRWEWGMAAGAGGGRPIRERIDRRVEINFTILDSCAFMRICRVRLRSC
jgi:hypothetical protein